MRQFYPVSHDRILLVAPAAPPAFYFDVGSGLGQDFVEFVA